MSTHTTDYLDAIEHLPEGATLVIPRFTWDDYERLLEHLSDRPHLRVSYDRGKLEVMSPLPEHENCVQFIDDLVLIFSEKLGLQLEKYGQTTWRRRRLERGVEADACYYVEGADRIIGKRDIDLEFDPPPDIAVEIDITNPSSGKFPIYAALSIREIWRYDGNTMRFYELAGAAYREIQESRFLPGLKPQMLVEALEQSKIEGQTAARQTFRQRLQNP